MEELLQRAVQVIREGGKGVALTGVGISAESGAVFPQCDCGGRTRFDFVAFGEGVQDLEKAIKDVESCGWMLIVGTSGVVYPAASLPGRAKNKGAFLMEINPRESDLTPGCDLFLQGSAAETLPKLLAELKKTERPIEQIGREP